MRIEISWGRKAREVRLQERWRHAVIKFRLAISIKTAIKINKESNLATEEY